MAETGPADERLAVRKRRGYWIRRARERQGLKEDALAVKLGYVKGSGSVIAKWESGVRAVPSDRFPAIASETGLPAAWLVDPPLTDEERLDQAVLEASAAEREDREADAVRPVMRLPVRDRRADDAARGLLRDRGRPAPDASRSR